jgi:hypothetical protein
MSNYSNNYRVKSNNHQLNNNHQIKKTLFNNNRIEYNQKKK